MGLSLNPNSELQALARREDARSIHSLHLSQVMQQFEGLGALGLGFQRAEGDLNDSGRVLGLLE